MSIAKALLEFQADAPALQRDAINPHFKSKFISLENLMSQVIPIANKHGLVISQFPTTLDGQPALRTRITHAESGEHIEDVMLLQAGKQDPQAQGSAITYARRYALMAGLGLVADEDDDGARASEKAPATEKPTPFKAPEGPRGGKAEEIRIREHHDELVALVQELGATDSLPSIHEHAAAGDIDWLERQIVTAKKHLAERVKV